MTKMQFGPRQPVEPGIVRFEDDDQTLEVTTLPGPGNRPHFVMEYEGQRGSDGIVINPAQVLNRGNFGPDSRKIRRFYEGLDDRFLETVREQLQNQDPPTNEAEQEIYYAALAFLHTPLEESDLKETRRMTKEKGRKGSKGRKEA